MSEFQPIPAAVTRKTAVRELIAVALAGAGYVVAELCQVPKRWILIGVGGALALYGLILWRRNQETWRDFGLRRDTFLDSAAAAGIWTLLAGVGIVVWARWREVSLWQPELIFLLPLYPVYGIAQQAVFQGVVHRRLRVVTGSRWMSILGTAVGFGAVHAGNWRLAGLAFAAGFVWSWIFSWRPNVWTLGLSHGFLAALVYPLVLGDNPLARI
jgi:membrane protease YdiL (CAAX protease family)